MAESNLDDSSHYELSLTAGQAFIAFGLLLLSLAASFAFGIMIGKGQIDDRLVVRQEPAVINEASAARKGDSKIVELGVPEGSEFEAPVTTETLSDTGSPAVPSIIEEAAKAEASVNPPNSAEAATQPSRDQNTAAPEPAVPFYAQLLSSSDAAAAESLAAKLIDNGFPTAYVERLTSGAAPTYRVRVRFRSEAEARAAVDRLKAFSKGEVWVTRQ